jgi:hypothetical protein
MTKEYLKAPLDLGGYPTLYADRLVIEESGPVCHLIFCTVQKVDNERRAVIAGRVIVPAALLAVFSHQLANPETARGEAAGFDFEKERAVH